MLIFLAIIEFGPSAPIIVLVFTFFMLFEALRIKDEEDSDLSSDDELLKKAIALAHGHHFVEAYKILKKLLKMNSHNSAGWLWY